MKAEGIRDVYDYFLQRYIFLENHLKKNVWMDFTRPRNLQGRGGRRQRDLRGRAIGPRAVQRDHADSAAGRAAGRAAVLRRGRRMVPHRLGIPARRRPPAGPGQWKRPARPCAPGSSRWAPAPGRHGARPQRACPSRWRNCMPGGPDVVLDLSTAPPDNWWNKSPPTRSMPPWSPGHHLGWTPIRRWSAPCVSRGPAAGPARRPPARCKAPPIYSYHTLAAFTAAAPTPHWRGLDARRLAAPAPGAGAGVVPRHHRLRGGGAARVWPQAVWDLMREPPPCAWCPCRPATRCWCAGAATSRLRWRAAGRTARHTAAHRRLDFIALTRPPFKRACP